jgi:dTDP-4-amino-4,6-dideoxygalactose transaminase
LSGGPGGRIEMLDPAAQARRLGGRLERRIAAVMAHGRFILGPEVAELEAALAAFTGAAHAVGVASGRDALVIALMAEDIGPGDAVFVPAFTFIASAGAVAAVGARPVFVDVDARTFLMDPADLARRARRLAGEGALRPRAVMPVDLFGLPADYEGLAKAAAGLGLAVIADAAQSLGGRRGNRRVGTLAPTTATSFFPTKPLGGAGDGGCLFTDDAARADRFRQIRVHGLDAEGMAVRQGMTGRLDTLQAAILLAKLDVFEEELEERRRLAALYDEALAGIVERPVRVEGADSAWALYCILTDRRDALRAHLAAAGIAARVYYETPLHLQPAFAPWGEGPGSLPVSENLARRILSLPLHPYMGDEAILRVAGEVRAALAG